MIPFSLPTKLEWEMHSHNKGTGQSVSPSVLRAKLLLADYMIAVCNTNWPHSVKFWGFKYAYRFPAEDLNLDPSDIKMTVFWVYSVQCVHPLYKIGRFSSVLSNKSNISIPTALKLHPN